MSEHKSVKDLAPDGEMLDLTRMSKLLGLLFSVGAGALVLFAALALKESWRATMAYSWLFAFSCFFTIALGGIFWTLLHNATNSVWGITVRRLMEQLGSMMPWMALFALPMLLVPDARESLWEWIGDRREMLAAGQEHASSHLEHEVAEWKHQVEEAGAGLEVLKKEISAGLEGASPGQSAFLAEKLATAEAEVDELSASASMPTFESVRDHAMIEHNVLLYKKSGYLNMGFWALRLLAYFVILSGMIRFLRGNSVAQDSTGKPVHSLRNRRMSCGFLPIFAVSLTFSVIDLLMCLDYSWFSTMWGVYLFAGSALSSMAVLILALTYLRSLGYLKEVVSMEHYHSMGKLLLSFVIFWAYIAFSQFFLIWYANITEETKFFLIRNTEQWNTLSMAIVAFHFFLPFLLLLRRAAKKNPRFISAAAVYLLFLHLLDIYWIVIPERGPSLGVGLVVPGAFIFDLIAFVGIGALAAYIFLRSLAKQSLYPCRDPRLEESVNLVN
ncbi:MAG: hypothetical protein ACC661_07165 [Verrucomicrobiales bacterium]